MKKNYFMLAAATMMFAACAETDLVNEITVEETQQAIGFETFAQKATRAESTAENSGAAYSADLSDHHSDFLVWASKNVTSGYVAVYPDNDPGTVSHNTTTWTADPLKYWDKTATDYQFYAAAPATLGTETGAPAWAIKEGTSTVGTDGELYLANYTLTGANTDNLASSTGDSWKVLTSAKDIDLMIAAPCKVDNIQSPSAVNLDFIHILSRLNIAVKATTTETEESETIDGQTVTTTTYSPHIKLKALNVCGLKNKGTFDESIRTITTQVDKTDENGNVVTDENGQTEKVDKTEDIDLDAGTHLRWGTPTLDNTYTLGAYLGTENDGLTLTTTAADTHKYLIIPQTVANTSNSMNVASAPSGEAYLQIQYTVDGEAYETYYSLAAAFGMPEGSSLAFNEGWQNTLTITISPDAITFTGDVATWADKTIKEDQTID